MKETFSTILAQAVQDLTLHGFDSKARLDKWADKLRQSAHKALPSTDRLSKTMRAALTGLYEKAISGRLLKNHPGVSLFTIRRIEPYLRSELDRRIMASVDLIKVNREEAIDRTLKRFAGWATSVPPGGSKVQDKTDVKRTVYKSLKSMRFEERRLYIDQGHKLLSNISAVVAIQSEAIAGEWNHVHQKGYDGRPEHIARDGKVFAIRGSWALEKGYINKGAGFLDEIDAAGMLPFCRCAVTYYQNLDDLPKSMLTEAGQAINK
jgi:hypothetical protein